MRKLMCLCLVLGMISVAGAGFVDNFDSYTAGELSSTSDWLSKGSSADQTVVDDGTGNLYYQTTNTSYYYSRGATVDLAAENVIADGESATLSFSITALTETFNMSVGLVDVEAASSATQEWGYYGPYVGFKNGSLMYRDSSGVFHEAATIVTGQWYNVELVVDNANDTFDAYLDGVLVVDDNSFRKDPSGDLVAFKVLHSGGADSGYGTLGIDNIAIVPEPATMALLGLGSLVISRRKK